MTSLNFTVFLIIRYCVYSLATRLFGFNRNIACEHLASALKKKFWRKDRILKKIFRFVYTLKKIDNNVPPVGANLVFLP